MDNDTQISSSPHSWVIQKPLEEHYILKRIIKKVSEFFGVGVRVRKNFSSESELESESKKNIFRSSGRVSESKSVTPLITSIDRVFYKEKGHQLFIHRWNRDRIGQNK